MIVGDLNADPDEGSSLGNPIDTFLLDHPRINADATPLADSAGQAAYPELDPDDTAHGGLRVDYVLPSTDVRVLGGEVCAARPQRHGGRGTERSLSRVARPRRASR